MVGWDLHQLHLSEHLLSDLLAMNLGTKLCPFKAKGEQRLRCDVTLISY